MINAIVIIVLLILLQDTLVSFHHLFQCITTSIQLAAYVGIAITSRGNSIDVSGFHTFIEHLERFYKTRVVILRLKWTRIHPVRLLLQFVRRFGEFMRLCSPDGITRVSQGCKESRMVLREWKCAGTGSLGSLFLGCFIFSSIYYFPGSIIYLLFKFLKKRLGRCLCSDSQKANGANKK